jgi:hypothetical protein
MKYGAMPLGHPRVLTREQLMPLHEAQLPWTSPEEQPYRGFLHCLVLAPQRMPGGRPALLPYRTSDRRLVFTCCGACAERRQQRPCRHTPRQRAWTAAYTHVELNRALALGYQVLDLFEVEGEGETYERARSH